MKLRDGLVYGLCLLLCIFITALALKRICLPVDIFSISIDPLISQKVRTDLAKQLNLELKEQPDINTHLHAIKEHYPFIDYIQIKKIELNKMHVSVTVSPPWFLINDQYILLRNGAIVSQLLFEPSVTHSLHSFYLKAGDKKIDAVLCAWLKQQNECMFDTFHVTIKSPLEIVLSDPVSKMDQIICSAHQNITASVLAQAASILNYIKSQSSSKKTADLFSIDIRFSGHIVLRKNKGKGCV